MLGMNWLKVQWLASLLNKINLRNNIIIIILLIENYFLDITLIIIKY